jgi:hypothetical protein
MKGKKKKKNVRKRALIDGLVGALLAGGLSESAHLSQLREDVPNRGSAGLLAAGGRRASSVGADGYGDGHGDGETSRSSFSMLSGAYHPLCFAVVVALASRVATCRLAMAASPQKRFPVSWSSGAWKLRVQICTSNLGSSTSVNGTASGIVTLAPAR